MMTRIAYVDTSIVTNALLKWGRDRDLALEALRAYEVTLLPDYAVREFQAGPLCNYVWAHNCFAGMPTLDDVRERIDVIAPTPQRNKYLTALGALKGARLAVLVEYKRIIAERQLAWSSAEQVKVRLIRSQLANKIFEAVAGLETVCTQRTHRLPCLEAVQLKQVGDELRVTGKRMDCAEAAECGLTEHLANQEDCLRKILAATEEQNTSAPKQELVRRADAIKAVLDGSTVPRKMCRGLGDAVFAALAPAGATILTTNEQDHLPLATCVGKSVSRS